MVEMITHLQNEDGTWRELTGEEKIRVNEERLGLSRMEQEFINKLEAGEIDGDTIELDEDGNRILRNPQPAPWLTDGSLD